MISIKDYVIKFYLLYESVRVINPDICLTYHNSKSITQPQKQMSITSRIRNRITQLEAIRQGFIVSIFKEVFHGRERFSNQRFTAVNLFEVLKRKFKILVILHDCLTSIPYIGYIFEKESTRH